MKVPTWATVISDRRIRKFALKNGVKNPWLELRGKKPTFELVEEAIRIIARSLDLSSNDTFDKVSRFCLKDAGFDHRGNIRDCKKVIGNGNVSYHGLLKALDKMGYNTEKLYYFLGSKYAPMWVRNPDSKFWDFVLAFSPLMKNYEEEFARAINVLSRYYDISDLAMIYRIETSVYTAEEIMLKHIFSAFNGYIKEPQAAVIRKDKTGEWAINLQGGRWCYDFARERIVCF